MDNLQVKVSRNFCKCLLPTTIYLLMSYHVHQGLISHISIMLFLTNR